MTIGISSDVAERDKKLRSVVKDHYLFDEDGDEALAKRFSQPAQSHVLHNIHFEFTRDPDLLKQYYKIRDEAYQQVYGLKHFDGGEDEYDSISDILIVRNGSSCIGGARLIVSTPERPIRLFLESKDFLLKDALPELPLDSMRYGELSRLALLPEYTTGPIFEKMCAAANLRCKHHKLDYFFVVTTRILARRISHVYRKMGLHVILRPDISLPQKAEYEHHKLFLTQLDMHQMDLPEVYQQVKGTVDSEDNSSSPLVNA